MAIPNRVSKGIVVSGLIMALCALLFPAAYGAQTGYSLPFEGSTNVTNGPGEGAHGGRSSEAIDFDLDFGTPVYPTKPGQAIERGYDKFGYGLYVKVRHDDGDVSLYAHLSEIAVRLNQRVGYGDKLGAVGNSGNVYPRPNDCPRRPLCGDHLHIEVRNSDESQGINVRYLVDWKPGCPGCNDYIKGFAIGEPKGAPPTPPRGRWEGMVIQQPPTTLYPMVMSLKECTEGSVCGSIDYEFPWLGTTCGGTLTFLGKFDNRYRFRERITHGIQQCVDNGTIEIEPNGADQWVWIWDKPGTQYHADAVLEKTE